jgi:5'/3'-nucleotidase SurE
MSKRKPFILITGDDSVRAEGIILVKRIVEGFADFKIIATKDQQSGVGGKINLKDGGRWGKEIVDGVETIWLDGTPGDAVYFAFDYLKQKPDLVICGVNMGPNFSNGNMFISGTVSAAAIASISRKTPTIAFSMDISGDKWFKDHNGEFDEILLEYPGKMIGKFIKLALKKGMAENSFWNINFPKTQTERVKIVKTYKGAQFPNRIIIQNDKYAYNPEFGEIKAPNFTDVKELSKGFITFTPCSIQFTDVTEFMRLRSIKKLFS